MNSRNQTADLLKGVAIVLMIQVHLMEQFATVDLYQSILGKISLFLGGPPAAPVFLVAMGFFLERSKKSLPQQLRRGVLLIVGGIALNLGLNANLLYSIHQGRFGFNPLAYIFGADILPVAGLSVIIVSILKHKAGFNTTSYLLVALIVAAAAPFLSGIATSSTLLYVTPFLWGDQWWSYFPLFPWLAYSLLGATLAVLPSNTGKTTVAVAGLAAAVFLTSYFTVPDIIDLTRYYHHGILLFLWITGFLTLWFLVFERIESASRKTPLVRYLKWLGRNVTSAYVFQWLIIGNVATELYRTQSLPQLMMWFVVALLATSLLVKLMKPADNVLEDSTNPD